MSNQNNSIEMVFFSSTPQHDTKTFLDIPGEFLQGNSSSGITVAY